MFISLPVMFVFVWLCYCYDKSQEAKFAAIRNSNDDDDDADGWTSEEYAEVCLARDNIERAQKEEEEMKKLEAAKANLMTKEEVEAAKAKFLAWRPEGWKGDCNTVAVVEESKKWEPDEAINTLKELQARCKTLQG